MIVSIRYLSLLAILAIALAACGAAPAAQPPTPLPTGTAPAPTQAPTTPAPTVVPTTVSATAVAPISVTDDLGRTVTLDAVPRRIVSLAPSVTEILFAIGADPRVVGNTRFCNYPPEAADLPEIGGFSASSISIEAIVGLEPDLVIAGTARQQPVVEQLEQLGVPVVVLAPASVDAVYASILQVGVLTGNSDEAMQVVATMQDRIAAVADVVATIPDTERPTVYWEVFNDPLTTTGPNTFIGQMMALIGATNIFADASEDYPAISPETVFERNPQVILGPDSQGDLLTAEALSERPGWADIQAVRDGRVYTLDGDIISRPGPRLADAIESLAATLYPAAFGTPSSATGGFPLTIENCGITQTYDAPPARAVTMNQHVTEVMLALGLQDRLVGTAYLDDAILPEYQAAYDAIPVLAEEYPALEVLLAAQPDFVYGGFRSAFAEDSGRTRAALAENGANSFLSTEYCAEGPVTMETVYADIRAIGAIFDVLERAEALIGEMQAQIDAVQAKLPSGERLRVFVYDSGEDTPFTAGGNGIANEIITLAGGENIFADLNETFGEPSWEEVIARDPEVILIFDYGDTSAEQKQEFLLNTPALAGISAIQNERFAVLPLSSVVAGVRNPDAVEQVERALYPEAFK